MNEQELLTEIKKLEGVYLKPQTFKQYKNYTLPARRLAISNRSFSLKNMNKKFEEILNRYLPKFEEQPQAVNLKLPKLKKIEKNEPTKIKLPKLKRI